ncbi:type II secretion system protein [Patescibacteria group bacterium]
MIYKDKNNTGLTMIELLMVILIIGILTAVVVSVVNPQRQRDYAQDGVLRANMNKVCAGIETYYQGENEAYPLEGTEGNPLHASATPTHTVAAFYIAEWPQGFVYNVVGAEFSIHVQQVGNTNYYKCNSTWKNVRECADTTVLDEIQTCDPII